MTPATIRGTRADAVSFLETLISIPSPSGEEAAVSRYLVREMTVLGFQTYRDEVGNAIGIIGNPGARRKIVLLGHMDTVSGQVEVRQEKGKLYGRGAVDAKGPLATFVLAAARVAECLKDAQVVVIGAVEEEAEGRGAHHLASTMAPPYCTIIGEPSDWQAITLGYKGVLNVDYQLVQSRQHTAGQGTAPAQQAVDFWNRLVAYAAEANQGQTRIFNALDPYLREIQTFGNGLTEGVKMAIGLRLPPGCDVAALQGQMESWRGEAELTFPYHEVPYRAEKNTPLVRALLPAIRAEGGKPRFKLKTGTSDMNVLGPAWGCPIVAYGPGDSALDHTPEEHIVIDEYLKGIDVLGRALKTLSCK
jgi:LysW-gamma-L-lysine carboxypeptidase